jgi:hypothetical protein
MKSCLNNLQCFLVRFASRVVDPDDFCPDPDPSRNYSSLFRHQEGMYECSASNGIGTPATTQINIHVLCKYLSLILNTTNK